MRDKGCPPRASNRGLEVAENGLSGLPLEVERATSREEWEFVLDLFEDLAATGIEDCLQPVLESKLAVLLSDQVDHGQAGLVMRSPQPATDLLGEDSGGGSWPQE